jgi:hypothetical protein
MMRSRAATGHHLKCVHKHTSYHTERFTNIVKLSVIFKFVETSSFPRCSRSQSLDMAAFTPTFRERRPGNNTKQTDLAPAFPGIYLETVRSW